MGDAHNSPETDIGRLLGDHYEEIEMHESFRNRLLRTTRSVIAGRSPVRSRRWGLAFAIGAAAAVAALVLWGHPVSRLTGLYSRLLPAQPARPSPMKVIAVQPPVTDASGRSLQVGDILAPASVVRTGEGGRVTLVTRRGSEFTLNANTELALDSEAGSAALADGQLYCRSRGGEIAQITTSAGEIHLLGTVLDAAVQEEDTVAVTVVEGQVRLTNDQGEALVEAGRRSLLIASLPPEEGRPANTFAQTAWYDGRGEIVSDFGEIAYLVRREAAQGLATEVWTMNSDGTGKHHVKTYLGWGRAPGPWLPGQQWLLINTSSALWGRPDFKEGSAHTSAGHPIVEGQAWLLNAATGQDIPCDLPVGYDPLYLALSPDSTRLAFCGSYRANPEDRESVEGGVWVYDLETGDIAKVLDGWIKTPVSWGPESRYLATSRGQDYGTHHPLVVVNVDTGDVLDLAVQGAGPSFSPDGTMLAYCGDFQRGGSWYRGVPKSGSIWVVDSTSDAPPLRISHPSDGALEPQWSPDGTRVLYRHIRSGSYTLFVAAADGSGVIKVYEEPADLRTAAWAPAGDAIYAATDEGIRLIAADGSGLIEDMGGNEHDSVADPDQQVEMDQALSAIQDAIFQYAVGNVRRFEGNARGANAAFHAADSIFASIVWEYPLAQFSHAQLLLYADTAAREASRPGDEVLLQSCKERIRYLEILLALYVGDEEQFPPSLEALEQHALEADWGINWISNRDTKWVKMMFRCPVCGSFSYHAPAEELDFGHVLVSCPCHPDHQLIWTIRLGQRVSWRQGAAVREAERENEQLQRLLEEAEDIRHRASMGELTWRDAEAAYLAVLQESPQNSIAREYLGRIYARRGEFQRALDVLPTYRAGWSALHRAFCYDALGRRAKAIPLYQSIVDTMPGSTPALWAERGLEEPTWMHDIDLPAEPGEVRIAPTEEWCVSATLVEWAKPSRPEFAIDGSRATPWTTGGQEYGQEPGEHFQLDFGRPQLVSRILLDHHGEASIYPTGWPRGVKASATDDGTSWHSVDVAQGGLMTPVTVRFSPPREIRGIRFETTATHDPEWWGIFEVFVFAPEQ